ncbi:MAG: serine/threonine-protein kinase, partial [Candidatus Eisenbacteria bacterium]
MKLPYDFGKYELRRELGKGAFARVFLAWHRALEQNMVLKILRPEIREEPELLERFKGEAKIMASMWHQNIVRVTDMDEWEDSLYIAMEHVEGMDLEDWIKKHGTPPLEITLLMLADICRGLAMAHTRTIHRDIKPANMIFSHDGLVKLMDFGLARRIEDVSLALTQVGTVMGTVAYMSPEQDMAEALDRRTDIFSVGVVAYRMLTGDRPFPGSTSSEIRTALRNREPRPLHELNREVPNAAASMVHSMLEKERERRCQKIEDAGAVFERAATRLGVGDGRALLRRYYASPESVSRELVANRRPAENEALEQEAPLDETVVADPPPEPPGLDETVVADSASTGESSRRRRPQPPARTVDTDSGRHEAEPIGRRGVLAGVPPAVLIALALVVIAGGAFAVVRILDRSTDRSDAAISVLTDPAPGSGATTEAIPRPDPPAVAKSEVKKPALVAGGGSVSS